MISASIRIVLLAALPRQFAALQAWSAWNSTQGLDMPYLTKTKDEAKQECHDTTRRLCDSHEKVDFRNKAIEAGRHLKSMRTVCRGAKWDGVACKRHLEEYRHDTIHHVRRWLTAADSKAFHRSIRMCLPPPVHHFRGGGGLRADIPCRKDGSAALFFRHIYKAAGFAIKWNLADQCEPKFKETEVNDVDWYKNNRCQQYKDMKKEGHPTLFTFVRNPIQKFIAGYKEVTSRGEVGPLRGHHAGSADHAKAFLDMVFHGTCDNGHILLQSQTLINDACESKFDFIGKIEHFDKDWAELSKEAWCDKEQLGWPVDVHHESERDDSYKFEDSMKEVLHQNDYAVLKALCWWVLPDFAIFHYDLPPPCANDVNLKHAIAQL